jgi:hypothetical protein
MTTRKGLSSAISGLEAPPGLAFLICLHVVVCSISLVDIAFSKQSGSFDAGPFHIAYDQARLFGASAVTSGFAVVALLFVFARFSFGYFLGFYLYTMVLGYLWINYFSESSYDHQLAGFSAALSALAFLLPALLITSPIRQVYALSARSFERLPAFLLLVAAATLLVGGFYNFKLVAIGHIYDFRDKIAFPVIVAYLIPMTSSVLLPFAFACFVARRNYWRAGMALVFALLLYPVTLSKLALFAPAWLVVMALLARIFGARTAGILSLFLPILAGVLMVACGIRTSYFYIVNFRMLAVPSAAMEFYNQFFSEHPLTHFCQIQILKPFMSCSYNEQLSTIMETAYGLGKYNASLFATEGIASVGLIFAPVSALACGLVIGLANRLSAGLPDSFILTSGAVLLQVALNVPFSTTILTYGAAVLFLLWYITPRAVFQQNESEQNPRTMIDEDRTKPAAGSDVSPIQNRRA